MRFEIELFAELTDILKSGQSISQNIVFGRKPLDPNSEVMPKLRDPKKLKQLQDSRIGGSVG